MLRLIQRTPDERGYYRQGKYSLVIANKTSEGIVADPPVDEFVFRPNPTDLDGAIQFPNSVYPDQAGGFYVEVNEIGGKNLSIRGTTGQFPVSTIVDQVMGAQGSAISSTFRGIIPQLGSTDGYHIFIELYNFFVHYAELVRDAPHQYALLFLSTKDAVVYHVVPQNFREIRTSARPLTYGYSIDLQVIGEQTPHFTRTWAERMDDFRSQINQWTTAINNTLLLASQLMQDIAGFAVGGVFGPITDTVGSMTRGIQSLVFTADAIGKNTVSSHEGMIEVVEAMFREETYTAGANAPTRNVSTNSPPHSMINDMVPPTSVAIYDAFVPGTKDILWNTLKMVTGEAYGYGERSALSLDSQNIENYGNALQMMFEVYRMADLAPLPDFSPGGMAGSESRDMHRAARIGVAGIIDGRTDEFASASLSGSTVMVDDDVTGDSTRHAVRRMKAFDNYTLSNLAAQVIHQWSQSSSQRISPQLNAFRSWFLNMRDPATFAPLYKNVTVQLDDTIYSLATKYLGTWKRWCEIALVNGLKYPYISRSGGPYQKKPGEVIYIPMETAKVPVEVVENVLGITKVHDRVTDQDAFLGFDIEINPTSGDTVYSVYDVGHIAGQSAYLQEIALILSGRGGVTTDANSGPLIRVGTKGKGRASVEYWQGLIKQWFVQDPRVASVDWVMVKQEHDTVYYQAKIRFVNYDSAVTLAGELRN